MERRHAGHAGGLAVVRVVVDEDARGGVEPVAVAEQLEDGGVGLHETLAAGDHDAVEEAEDGRAAKLLLDAVRGVGEHIDAPAGLVQMARQLVGGLDNARVLGPVGQALADACVQPLGRVRQGHAQHGLVVDGARVKQRPLHAPEGSLIERPRVFLATGKRPRELVSVKGHEHVSHVKDDVSACGHGTSSGVGVIVARRSGAHPDYVGEWQNCGFRDAPVRKSWSVVNCCLVSRAFFS